MYIYANCLHILQPPELPSYQGTEPWKIISGQCYLGTALQVTFMQCILQGQSIHVIVKHNNL